MLQHFILFIISLLTILLYNNLEEQCQNINIGYQRRYKTSKQDDATQRSEEELGKVPL